MKSAVSTISAAWEAETCPIVNAIFFADGRVVQLEVEDASSPSRSAHISPSASTSFETLSADDAVQWTYLTSLGECENTTRGLAVVFGEGGFGGDGFVALLDQATKQLMWLVFLDCSNPFQHAAFDDDAIVATTNTGVLWRFPIQYPEKVTTRRLEL